jgi:hypothetical protein
MKSLRVWLSGIALGAALVFSVPSAQAQMPIGFTYQGLLEQNGAPVSGSVTFNITLTDIRGNSLYTETLSNQIVTNGIFNVIVGGPSFPFPATMDFNQQYLMDVVVVTSNGTTTLPLTQLWDAPYAINSFTVNGLQASATPVVGDLFPVPIDGENYVGTLKMDPGFLPIIPNNLLQSPDIQTINGIVPNTNGDFQVSGSNGISVTSGTNGITISSSVQGGVADVLADSGLVVESAGNAGVIELRIADGGVTSDMLATPLNIGSNSSGSTTLSVENAEANGNNALLVQGGIGANNATGAADGTGLTSGSAQTYWADQVSVPSATGTSMQIYNKLVSTSSTIILTPVGSNATAGQIVITSQNAGTFTVTSTSNMGTSAGGTLTALNYMVVNH